MVRGLQVVVDKPSYKRFGHSIPESVRPVMVHGLVDAGAQITVISLTLAQRLGVKANEMISASRKIMMGKGDSMDIVGGIPIKIIHNFNGRVMESKQLAYIATGAN